MKINDMERSLQVFRGYVERAEPFPKDLYDVYYWENVIYDWIRGLPEHDDHMVLSMQKLCHSLCDLFPYDGTIYRGTQLNPQHKMETKHIASFSSYAEVALFFAGISEVYGENEQPGLTNRTLISTEHLEAFHLADFLDHIRPHVSLDGFAYLIDERNWESEVIAPLTDEMIASALPLHEIQKGCVLG